MAKKSKKRKLRMPPLSFVDKMIYALVLLALGALDVGLLFGTIVLRNKIALRDEMVVAVEDNASLLWLLVPWMTVFLMTFIMCLLVYESRKPIFGLRNFQYGPPKWPKVYPLFMKNKPPVYISERKKKERKQLAVFLLLVLLISFIPYPLSLYGRDCLHSDGSIVQYNMFNGRFREFESGEIKTVEIETYRSTRGKGVKTKRWNVRMVFTTDSGREYSFDIGAFRNDISTDTPYWLTAMLQLKRRYDPGIITYSGVENLEKVVSDRNLTAEEKQLLYQLFGQ